MIKSDKFEGHCLSMADIALKVGARLDLKNDALQACFATVLICADKHGVFLEPAPPNSKTLVTDAETDARAAKKADDQILNTPRVSTPERAEGVERTELLKAVEEARGLLNKAGHDPVVTPKALNALIKKKLDVDGLSLLDNEQLGQLLKMLSDRLDELKKKIEEDESVPF